ncbi:hypothetical protein AAY473_031339, partial [Plecturocebus cupreus]
MGTNGNLLLPAPISLKAGEQKIWLWLWTIQAPTVMVSHHNSLEGGPTRNVQGRNPPPGDICTVCVVYYELPMTLAWIQDPKEPWGAEE